MTTPDGTDRRRGDVKRYVENHPDADRWEVLAALGLGPAHADVVDDVLEGGQTADTPHTAIDNNPTQHRRRPAAAEAAAVAGPEHDDHEDAGADIEDLMAVAMGDPDAVQDGALEHDPEPDAEWNPEAGGVGAPVGAIPIQQLDALPPAERRRAAKKRGLDWPTTDDARERLLRTITEVMRHEDDRVIDAPTSLGKSHTVTTTPWHTPQYRDVTGGRPVIHLSATRDARDEAVARAANHYPAHEWMVLKSRHEACPVAAGTHDPPTDGDLGDVDHEVITIGGVAASEWITQVCDGKGIAFSSAHRYLEKHNDQGTTLPCCRGSDTTYDEDAGDFDDGEPAQCEAIRQWDRLRDGEHSLVLATHNFAFVPRLRANTNLVFDEEPDFAQELGTDRVRRAVGAYLREIDAPVQTWEAFVSLARYDGWGDDAGNEREALGDVLDREPDRDWYFAEDDAHVLAPAIARAVFHADDRANGRRVGKTPYEPPRLDAHARDDDGWNQTWVTVVLDDTNDVRTVRTAPGLSQARSVVGLDAHPCLPKWQANTLPYIERRRVLSPTERQLWRRYERGLRVVQIGTATRPAGSEGRYYDHDGDRAVLEQLVDQYGDDISAAIGPKTCEHHLRDNMQAAGIDDPQRMHYGEEKSRNDYADERVGFVTHCIDPGDDHIVDLLAELDLDAAPETTDVEIDDGEIEERREHGRGFTGPDSATAAAILASVRENHVAQAAGRWARNPDDPSSTATVYVRTDAVPTGFADVQTAGVVWTYGTKQERVVEALRDADDRVTARQLADEADCSKELVRKTLRRLARLREDDDRTPLVDAVEEAGPHGATLYKDDGVPNAGVVDLDGIANYPVWSTYTWGLAIRDPDAVREQRSGPDTPDSSRSPDGSPWWAADDRGG